MKLIATFGEIVPLLVVVFVVAALISLLATPIVARVAEHFGAVDEPNHRRVNAKPVARGGGVAVAVSFLVVATIVVLVNEQLDLVVDPNRPELATFLAVMAGGLVAMLLGLLDDVLQLRARWQLLTQLVVAAVPVAAGVIPTQLNNPIGPGTIPVNQAAGIGFTVVWILGMINSINFIDGLDGLSSGIAIIAAVTLGIISFTTAVGVTGQPMVGVLCFILAGALLGFLRWNFHPAKIFIGTTGVMFVGYMLAILSILGAAKVAVALLVLGVPIIDTFWIIIRRVATGHSPFTPDRGHIHHRLLDLGLTHAQTVLFIYGICIVLAVLSIVLSSTAQQVYAFLGLMVVSGVGLFLVARGGNDALEADTYEGPPAPGV